MLNMTGNTSTKKYRYGHIILNLLRAFNIIGFLLIAASSWILIIKSNILSNYFVFEAISHVATSAFALVLLVSELPFKFLTTYFEANWPVLTDSHSFFWLGMAMLSMGCQVLGSLNRASEDVNTLGLPLWRTTVAAGVLAITFGGLNLICSFIWRVPSKNITARMIRDNGALAEEKFTQGSTYSYDASPKYERAERPSRANRITMMFKKGNKPVISQPMSQHDHDVEAAHPYPEIVVDDTPEDNLWESMDRRSPIVPGVQRPPTALHPAYTGKSTSSSRYSEVTHLNRF